MNIYEWFLLVCWMQSYVSLTRVCLHLACAKIATILYANNHLYVTHFANVDHILYNILFWRLQSCNSKTGLQWVLRTSKSKIRCYRLKGYKINMPTNWYHAAAIHSSTVYLHLRHPSGLICSVLPTKTLNALIFQCVLHAQPT